jgi:hypothetical protein
MPIVLLRRFRFWPPERRVYSVLAASPSTDAQALTACGAPIKVQLGTNLTKGLGAGANPEIGRNAILEDRDRLREILSGADMVFITAGLGGGTGTGGAPILATIAKEVGALTVAVVTKPFLFEGKRRQRQAEEGMKELRKSVDTLITIPNQRLLNIAGRDMSLLEAFRKADEVLLQAVKGISDLITVEGLINLDFADVRAVMKDAGQAWMSIGRGSGQKRAVDATEPDGAATKGLDGRHQFLVHQPARMATTTFRVSASVTLSPFTTGGNAQPGQPLGGHLGAAFLQNAKGVIRIRHRDTICIHAGWDEAEAGRAEVLDCQRRRMASEKRQRCNDGRCRQNHRRASACLRR